MLIIKKNPYADTRTCDFKNVTRQQLFDASRDHIQDVRQALEVFIGMIVNAEVKHDWDKLTDLDGFHADFLTGFAQHSWWDRHRKSNRHHLMQQDGIPLDVNLIDVLDFIADCVMSGMARSGEVDMAFLNLHPDVLWKAFENTIELLKKQVQVQE